MRASPSSSRPPTLAPFLSSPSSAPSPPFAHLPIERSLRGSQAPEAGAREHRRWQQTCQRWIGEEGEDKEEGVRSRRNALRLRGAAGKTDRILEEVGPPRRWRKRGRLAVERRAWDPGRCGLWWSGFSPLCSLLRHRIASPAPLSLTPCPLLSSCLAFRVLFRRTSELKAR